MVEWNIRSYEYELGARSAGGLGSKSCDLILTREGNTSPGLRRIISLTVRYIYIYKKELDAPLVGL